MSTAASMNTSMTMHTAMSMGRDHPPKDLGYVLHLGKTCEHVHIFLLGYEKTWQFVNLFWAIGIEQKRGYCTIIAPHMLYIILIRSLLACLKFDKIFCIFLSSTTTNEYDNKYDNK